MFDNIPEEMKSHKQWVVWRYEEVESGKPTKVPYSPITSRHASVTNIQSWGTYEEAVDVADKNSGIGFVLTEVDPFFVIDLDDPNGDAEIAMRQMAIYKEFEGTYGERSPSGNGLHIIGKGAIPSGRKRSKVEVYSKLRFITVTGDMFNDKPIIDYNEKINLLWEQMGKGAMASRVYCGAIEAKESDTDIVRKMLAALNGLKVEHLLNGNWQDYYPSQSEADLALVDIIAFYTQNRKQIERIFRNSALGQRDKAKRVDYLNWMVNKAFDNILPPVDIEGLRNKINEIKERKLEEAELDSTLKVDVEEEELKKFRPEKEIYSAPPGLLGEIAYFIYQQAPRPVPEIALVGAIGLMSGVIGRAYNISGTGTNQYILLLAPTGTGKEAIPSGTDKIMSAIIKRVPAAINFIGPGEIASSQALIKYMSNTANSFVSILGEFGLYLQQMSAVKAAPHMQGLKRLLLDLYNKSGEDKVLRPSIYSDKEKNTMAVQAPAFTLCGESTPEKFYEGLHEGMISEGLLPRFTIIEYNGKRPALSKTHNTAKLDDGMVERLSVLCSHCISLNQQNKTISVAMTDEAERIFNEFDRYCDNAINSSEREVRRHMWNRAHIKALKLAATVAVGVEPYNPTITEENAKWALNIVIADARNILRKFDSGEIGVQNDESNQFEDILGVFRDYATSSFDDVSKYGCKNSELHKDYIIPFSYIHKRLTQRGSFRRDKMGASYAIKRALRTLTDRGDIQEVSKKELMDKYDTSAVCYAIAVPKSFSL